MNNLDLTTLGVEKLDKKQMAEINGGQPANSNDLMDIAYAVYEKQNTGMKASGFLLQVAESLKPR